MAAQGMTPMRPLRYRSEALLWMVAGSVFVIGLMGILNQSEEPVRKGSSASSTSFEVKSVPKPKQEVERKPPPKPRNDTPPPPVPSALLNSNLSGIDLGLPGFSQEQAGAVDEGLLGDTDNVVMSDDMVDVAPRPKVRTEIEYPPRAAMREIEGYVTLSLLINRQGKVETVKVLEADPVDLFEEYAIRNVKNWLFEPARYKGKAVQTWATQTIRFQL